MGQRCHRHHDPCRRPHPRDDRERLQRRQPSPPLTTVCAAKESLTTKLIAEGGCFAVNVLAAHQQDLSNKFASKKLEMERFVGLETSELETGAPLLPEALVHLDCRLVATHDAGDHVIYVGEIVASVTHEGAPLVYWGGGYRTLAEDR